MLKIKIIVFISPRNNSPGQRRSGIGVLQLQSSLVTMRGRADADTAGSPGRRSSAGWQPSTSTRVEPSLVTTHHLPCIQTALDYVTSKYIDTAAEEETRR